MCGEWYGVVSFSTTLSLNVPGEDPTALLVPPTHARNLHTRCLSRGVFLEPSLRPLVMPEWQCH